jgi:hypothetical protein
LLDRGQDARDVAHAGLRYPFRKRPASVRPGPKMPHER